MLQVNTYTVYPTLWCELIAVVRLQNTAAWYILFMDDSGSWNALPKEDACGVFSGSGISGAADYALVFCKAFRTLNTALAYLHSEFNLTLSYSDTFYIKHFNGSVFHSTNKQEGLTNESVRHL